MVVAELLIGLALAAVPAATPARSDAEVLEQARNAFRQGIQVRDHADEARPLFREAAESFETLRRRGAGSPEFYRDQGNAYLLAGDLPRALLAYRRGLRLAPGDRDLQTNLTYARDQVAYPTAGSFGRPPADPYPPWLPRLAPVWLLVAAVAGYALVWVSLTRWWMLRQGRSLGLAVVAGLVTAGFAGALAVEEALGRDQSLRPLVVLARDGVLLRRGNGSSYPPGYDTPLNRGVEARLLYARGDWLQIELAGGEVGWVPARWVLRDDD